MECVCDRIHLDNTLKLDSQRQPPIVNAGYVPLRSRLVPVGLRLLLSRRDARGMLQMLESAQLAETKRHRQRTKLLRGRDPHFRAGFQGAV